MSRKSSLLAPGTFIIFHVEPPSTLRTTVPPVPLAQTTLPLTTERPRNPAFVATFCLIHWLNAEVESKPTTRKRMNNRTSFMQSSLNYFHYQPVPPAYPSLEIFKLNDHHALSASRGGTLTGEGSALTALCPLILTCAEIQ